VTKSRTPLNYRGIHIEDLGLFPPLSSRHDPASDRYVYKLCELMTVTLVSEHTVLN